MKNIIQWLVSYSKEAADCSRQDIVCGSDDLSISFIKTNAHSDPLSIHVCKNHEIKIQNHFMISAGDNVELRLQYVKKIKYTPFYYSLFQSAKLDLHIVDFYCWLPPITSIRLFTGTQPLTVEKQECIRSPELFELFGAVQYSKMVEGFLKNSYVYIVSVEPVKPDFKNLSKILSMLSSQTERCKKHHISHFFRTAEPESMNHLDYLWSRQKIINPDLSAADGLNQKEERKILLNYLSDYFGWEIEKKKIGYEFGKEIEKNKIFNGALLWRSFIQNIESDDSAYQVLNQWWGLYGLPVMARKLYKLIQTEPEWLTLTAILALQYQLPWANLFVDRIISGGLDSFCTLILWLSERILLRNMKNDLLIYPGYRWDNNLKEIRWLNNTIWIKCSRYGEREFVSVYSRRKRLYQVDKSIGITVNLLEKKIKGYALIRNSLYNHEEYPHFSLIVNGNYLYQPILFRKGEIFLSDLRLRWILKKNRFQTTLIPKDGVKTVSLNDNIIEMNKNFKTKYYIDAPIVKPKTCFTMLDNGGALVHKRKISGHRNIILSGWAMDKHGVFFESANYLAGKRQHTIPSNSDGKIRVVLHIPAANRSVGISCKGLPQIEKHLAFCADPAWERVIFFDSIAFIFPLQLCIGERLQPFLQIIRSFFLDTFDFIPEIVTGMNFHLYLTDVAKGKDKSKSIEIGKHAEKIEAVLNKLYENIFVFK